MEEKEDEAPLVLKIIGRTFWMTAAVLCFRKIVSYDLYRPSIWPLAKLCYGLIITLAIGSSAFLRLCIGRGVPRYRWRMYIPVPIYLLTVLHALSFVLMLLTFGFSPATFLLMIGVNIGLLSFLSFL